MDSPFTAFHWHGDVFNLPRDAMPLAHSELTVNQAFRYGRTAYGFLFHAEVTEQMVREMVGTFPGELAEAGADGDEVLADAARCLPGLRRVGETVFGRWARMAGEAIATCYTTGAP